MVSALVTGALYGPPQEKIAKSGRAYTVLTLKVRGTDDAVSWLRVTTFSDHVRSELLRLADGDAVTVQGPLKTELYTPAGGDPRVSLSMIADQALALRAPPKERSAKAIARETQRRSWQGPIDGPDDGLDGLEF